MPYCKIISGPRLIASYGSTGNAWFDLGISGSQDTIIYFNQIVFCRFAAVQADLDFAAADQFFALNAGADYRFTLNKDSRYLGVIPSGGGAWTVTVAQ